MENVELLLHIIIAVASLSAILFSSYSNIASGRCDPSFVDFHDQNTCFSGDLIDTLATTQAVIVVFQEDIVRHNETFHWYQLTGSRGCRKVALVWDMSRKRLRYTT